MDFKEIEKMVNKYDDLAYGGLRCGHGRRFCAEDPVYHGKTKKTERRYGDLEAVFSVGAYQ